MVKITIDPQEIAGRLVEHLGWDADDFGDSEVPRNWSEILLDSVPQYEELVLKEAQSIVESNAFDYKGAKAEIVRRFMRDEENHPLADSLAWLDKQTIVTTRKAFEIASSKTVIQIFADGTDSELDDLEFEDEYFPDKSKSWPEIETIFVVEGSL